MGVNRETRPVLTRDAILAATRIPTERVEVPEWGGFVTVRAMTAAERDAYEVDAARRIQNGDVADFRVRLAVASLVDDDGRPMFTEADIPALSQMWWAPLHKIAEAALAINGLNNGDVEDLAKN